MVIKTDELPAAAPGGQPQEPSSQAGGKGRPGAAGEWGRGQGTAGLEAGLGRVRAWVWGGARTAAFSPHLTGSHLAGPSTGRPRPEGHLHCRPRLRPGLDTRGIPGRAAAANTRVPDRGDVRAHAVSGCAGS